MEGQWYGFAANDKIRLAGMGSGADLVREGCTKGMAVRQSRWNESLQYV